VSISADPRGVKLMDRSSPSRISLPPSGARLSIPSHAGGSTSSHGSARGSGPAHMAGIRTNLE
jgi:hypothetical protein